MKQIPARVQPWLIAAWFVALFTWNLSSAWPANFDPSDLSRILLNAISMFLSPWQILLSLAVVAAVLIKWRW